MTDTLFDLPDSPSPHLQWMRRHGVRIEHIDDPEYPFPRWEAHYEGDNPILSDLPFLGWGYGSTKDEALTDFAINNNLKLWNEE